MSDFEIVLADEAMLISCCLRNDLWASAVAELNDKDRENINFSCPDRLDILSDLLKLTTQSKEECVKKRWRYTRKSGETIIFVDLFSKLARWIDMFKQVGDTAVQYDPVHAALPWAGVRFLLQVRRVKLVHEYN